MDFAGPIFETIKIEPIEADSDCAFFGIATGGAIGDVGVGQTTVSTATFANAGAGNSEAQKLGTLLSSVSPFTISNPSSSASLSTPTKPKAEGVSFIETSIYGQGHSIADSLLTSSDLTEVR